MPRARRPRPKNYAAIGVLSLGVAALACTALVWYVLDPFHRDAAVSARGRSFDGVRAYETLKEVVAIGPRPPGSSEAAALRDLIRTELAQAGLEVTEYPFDTDTPLGKRHMVNLVVVVKGTRPGVIALGNHYDTKFFDRFRFVGANDGGATTAWMIEMARTLGPARKGRSVWLLWFDGEEAFQEWTATDSLYGSRETVRRLRATQELGEVRALINLDMIGDCHLGIARDAGAPPWLVNVLWKSAAELGYERHFLAESQTIEDDHVPFRLAGVPCINLIDFEYGTSRAEHDATWHTANDTIDRVCPASLQAVGDVVYHALPAIESVLDAQARLD